jgi:TolB protein
MGRDPQWSPDGRRLAFEANGAVHVVRVRDRAVSRLRRGDWPSWSPDGGRIGFTLGSAVYVMDADGSRVKRVRTERGFDFTDGPVWSPDGRTLLYATLLAKSDLEIFAVDAVGSRLRQLTRNSVDDWGPAWSPNRRRIAFVRRRAIWLMAADGTKQRRLVPGVHPSWSPSGMRLAFARAGVVYTINAGGGPATRVVAGDSPAWSPSGAEIAFVRATRLFVFDLRTRSERAILDAGSSCPGSTYEASLYGPDWAPDGGGSSTPSPATTDASSRCRPNSSAQTAVAGRLYRSASSKGRDSPGRPTELVSRTSRMTRCDGWARPGSTGRSGRPWSEGPAAPPTATRTGSAYLGPREWATKE